MSLANIKLRQFSQGFTIVELLIVIVVIGILATITIVAYNNVISRANLTSAQAAAASIARKAEAFNAETSAYPVEPDDLIGNANTSYGIPAGSYTFVTTMSAQPSNPNTVVFYTCGSGAGVAVGYWDYTASPAALVGSSATSYTAGDTSGTCTAVAEGGE